MKLRTKRWRLRLTVALITLAACSGDTAPRDSGSSSDVFVPSGDGSIIVDAAAASIPIDRRLFGTNAPAWIGPERLGSATFRKQVIDLGTSLVRMPGGSWSSSYDWLACENSDDTGCFWTWAARPSDFADFLMGTGVAGMWTISFNETAQQAAALVAFFNGDVADKRVIGVDRDGVDWGTVGTWATLRADHGHPQPQRIAMWEIGNEVFGARPAAGSDCASFGWEDVWTCDGAAYVNGDASHDGYLAIRQAMLDVDPDIEIGAVGVGGDQNGWNGFGDEVIDGTAGAIDFYVIHNYGFDSTTSYRDVLRRPEHEWDPLLTDAQAALAATGEQVPIALTEYNLFAFVDGDQLGMMAQAASALYIADTLGQMATHGVSIANHWNLINGLSDTGSDYGMIDADSGDLNPSAYALRLWSDFGDELLPVKNGFDDDLELSVFAGRAADGTISLMLINKTDAAIGAKIRVDGMAGPFTATADEVSATAIDASEVSFNGSPGPSTAIASSPPRSLGSVPSDGFAFDVPAISVVLLHLR